MTLLNVLKKEAPHSGEQRSNAQAARHVRPRYDIRETDTEFEVDADLPGVNREQLQVTVEDGVLEIVGTRSLEAPKGFRRYGGAGADSTNYRLRLDLGDEVSEDRIAADLSDGVLRLTLPKVEEKRPRRIEIN